MSQYRMRKIGYSSDNFIDCHYDKIYKRTRSTVIKGKWSNYNNNLNLISESQNSSSRNWKPRCWRAREEGHLSKDCAKWKRVMSNEILVSWKKSLLILDHRLCKWTKNTQFPMVHITTVKVQASKHWHSKTWCIFMRKGWIFFVLQRKD